MGGRTQKPKTVNDYANTPIQQFATCGGMPPQQNYQTPTPPMSPAVMPDMSNAPWNQPGQQTSIASPFSGPLTQLENTGEVSQVPEHIREMLMGAGVAMPMGSDNLLDVPAAEEQQHLGGFSAPSVMPQTQNLGPEITMAQPAVQSNLPPQANGKGFGGGRANSWGKVERFGMGGMKRGY